MKDYEKILEIIEDRIDKEYEEYKQSQIQGSSSRADLFENCYEIAFYTAFYEFFNNCFDEEAPRAIIDMLAEIECPLSFLYGEYMRVDFHIGYSDETLMEFLSFVSKINTNDEEIVDEEKIYNVSYFNNEVPQTILVKALSELQAKAYISFKKPNAYICGVDEATKDDIRPDKPITSVPADFLKSDSFEMF